MPVRRFVAFLVLTHGVVFSALSSETKLIVVISLDQFRYDYLVRFREYYGAKGFRYLMQNGASFSNATYKHAFNMTGPGHAVILTGAYGNQNGIVTNSWYDQAQKQNVYCVADNSVSIVGGSGDGRSPANLIVPTFGDGLRLHTGFSSKVISISHKDRAAILMGGKMANGAFWLVDSSFVTSSYYMNYLPVWVQKFNASGVANSFFGKAWTRIVPDEAMMDIDDAPYESNWSTIGRSFPHLIRGEDTAHITKSYYPAMLTSPFGNEALAKFAKAAIEGESLGQNKFPDLLCIGFSSTDYVGHSFGPHSREAIEMAAQTDRMLSDLFNYVEKRIGLKNTIVVLTSDHGVTPIPEYVQSHLPNADVGRLSHVRLNEVVHSLLVSVFGAAGNGHTWIRRIVDGNIYINHEVVKEKKLNRETVAAVLADSVMNLREVALALPRQTLLTGCCNTGLEGKLKRSFHPRRSGDVLFAMRPYFYLEDATEGAEHGNPYEQDAHVPLIIMGQGIRNGTYVTEASPADVGPTLSALLGVEFPAAREGRVLVEALKLP